MKRSTITSVAAIVGGIVLLALVILGVSAISAPKSGELRAIQVPDAANGSIPGVTMPGGKPAGGGSTGATTSAGGSTSGTATVVDSSGSSSGGGSGTGTGSGKSSAAAPGAALVTNSNATGPIGPMLPTSVQGFTLSGKQVGSTEAAVFAEPVATSSGLTRATLTVYDRNTVANADAFITRISRVVYSKDVSQVSMFGRTAYFGTDGHLVATMVFSRGRYAYEVVGTSTVGQPAALRAELTVLARAFRPPGASQ
jgi:hypothetical protein